MEQQTKKTGNMINRKVRKAKLALAFSGTLLASGPMKIANAKPNPEKPKIGLETGIGYDGVQKDVRAMLVVNSEIPLPLRIKFQSSVGFASSLNNQDVGLEKVEAKVTVPVGPVTASAAYLRSKHDAVRNLAYGSVFTGLPIGAAGIAGGYLFDFKTVPLFGVFVLNPHPRLTFSALGGVVIRGDAGIVGGGAQIKLSEKTALKIDSWNILNKQGAVVASLKCGLGYTF
jgi:hypothetical protein